MQLGSAEKSAVYWRGALSSAIRGIPQGIVLGCIAAAVLFTVIAGMMLIGGPLAGVALSTAQAFGGFLYSHTAAAALATATTATAAPLITSIASVSILPIVLFNTVLTGIGNFLTGGNAAVDAYHQQKHNALYEAKIAELDGRERAVEQAIAPSHAVQKILTQGPLNATSFAAAQSARKQDQPQSPTLH